MNKYIPRSNSSEFNHIWKSTTISTKIFLELVLNRTSTTPSCGGPLRVQMFQKVFFMSKNSVPMVKSVTFGSLGHILPSLKGPPNSPKTYIFKNNNFFCFTLSHWAYLPKIMFLSRKLRLLAIKGPLGPLRALFKGPLNSS